MGNPVVPVSEHPVGTMALQKYLRLHKGTVLLCCFFPHLAVKFAPGVKKCQGQREKKQQGNLPRNAKGYRSSGHF